jgi:hypothetical protein
MQELVLNGKTYVKAVDIAKHLGYTSDYVGQLCRSGKVDAEQVGRAWYVVPDTIKSHKQSRYRSNVAKSRAAVAEYKASQRQHESRSAIQRTHHLRVHHYEVDETELFPSVRPKSVESTPVGKHIVSTDTKEASIAKPTQDRTDRVQVAKPKEIKVATVTKKHTFSAEREGQARFSGMLSVETADEEELLPKSEVAVKPQVFTPQSVIQSATSKFPDTEATTIPSKSQPGRVVVAAADQTESATIAIQTVPTTSIFRSSLPFRVTLASLWLVSMALLSIGVLGSEVVWLVSAESQVAMLQFDWSLVTNYINTYLSISSIR